MVINNFFHIVSLLTRVRIEYDIRSIYTNYKVNMYYPNPY